MLDRLTRVLNDRASSFVALALASALWFFISGVRLVPAAAWLAPAAMLFWTRSRRPALGYGVAVLAAAVPMYAAWKGALGAILPPALYAGLIVVFAAVYLLPYLLDRVVATRVPGFASTLVFPLAVATLEYVLSLTTPFGTWNALAYTQYGNLPLLQVMAVTGLTGVSFLVAWFAAVVNWATERVGRGRAFWPGVAVCGAVMAAALCGGGIRLALAPRDATVRIAGITPRPFYLAEHREIAEALWRGRPFTDEETAAARRDTAAINDDLFARTRREARAGARVVVWGEAAAQIMACDEAAFVARARALARDEGIYLGVASATLSPGRPKPVRNKFTLIAPDGGVLYDYAKTKPVPGFEDAVTERGDGRIPVAATPFGRLGAAICYDMDFPPLVRKKANGADIMLVPSHDWRELGDIHGTMAAFRAVENGYAVFRPDGDGHSLAVDRLGRVLGEADFFTADDAVLIAYVPVKGGRTPYAVAGDIFAWLAAAALLTLIVRAVLRKGDPHAGG